MSEAVVPEDGETPGKRKRPIPTMEDLFGVCVETNTLVKENCVQVTVLGERLGTVEADAAVTKTRIDSLEARLEKVEKSQVADKVVRTQSPERADELVLVIGTKAESGGQRPDITTVSAILGISEDHLKITHAGSTVVETMGTEHQFQVWKHKAQQTQLWVAERRTPQQQRTNTEWRAIQAWAKQLPLEAEVVIDFRKKQILAKTGLPIVYVTIKGDRIVWADHQMRVQWLGRPDVPSAQPQAEPQREPAVTSSSPVAESSAAAPE